MCKLQLNNTDWYKRGYATVSKLMYLDKMQEAEKNLKTLKNIKLDERQIQAMERNKRIIDNLKN